MRRDPVPVEAVRDLLGIARVMYRAERTGSGDPMKLQALKEIGETFRKALELAKAGPATLGNNAAWTWAQKATEELSRLVEADMPARVLVEAAAMRVRR